NIVDHKDTITHARHNIWFSTQPPQHVSRLVPYTTLFRSVSDGGRTYTVKLRGGVRFHDGSEMTSRDVKASYDVPRRHLAAVVERSEEHTSELQTRSDLVCRLLLEKKKSCNAS